MSFDLALINGNLKLQPNGLIKTVTDTPKLRQDIIKIVLTPLGSVKNHLWYGCSVAEDIGKNFPTNLQLSRICTSITQSIDKLKALQTSQCASQRTSLAELIDSVGAVDVERDIDDPRQLNVLVTIFSKRLSQIEELFTIIS